MSSYLVDGYYREAAAYAPESARVGFIRRTYGLLFLAILAFVGLEALLLNTGIGEDLRALMFGSRLAVFVTIGLFVGSGFLARSLARSETSPIVQLMGLGLYVFVEAIIFLPIMWACTTFPQFKGIPLQAGVLTLTVFGGLTAVVFISKKDFSFLGKFLFVGMWLAFGIAILFMFATPTGPGIWYSAVVIALACGYILYDTSNVLHHYPVTAHVAAALELFASVALLFYYIIRIMMQFSSSR
jgi:FtsH-binding integral membrane protein